MALKKILPLNIKIIFLKKRYIGVACIYYHSIVLDEHETYRTNYATSFLHHPENVIAISSL